MGACCDTDASPTEFCFRSVVLVDNKPLSNVLAALVLDLFGDVCSGETTSCAWTVESVSPLVDFRCAVSRGSS